LKKNNRRVGQYCGLLRQPAGRGRNPAKIQGGNDMVGKEWTKDEIKHLLETNDKMVSRSLVKLYECQTDDERSDGETHEHNGVGFNGIDSPFLSNIAQRALTGMALSKKQLAAARKALMKYAGQLAGIANAERKLEADE